MVGIVDCNVGLGYIRWLDWVERLLSVKGMLLGAKGMLLQGIKHHLQ